MQKTALKLILQDEYKSYENALNILDLETLHDRREYLCLSFARKCQKNEKIKKLFPPNNKQHIMYTRDEDHFNVLHANTNRYKDSPIIYMQNILNREIRRRRNENMLWNI